MPVRTAATRGVTGWCLEPHDLVVAKLVAGRDKDVAFAAEALRSRLVARRTLAAFANALPIAVELRELVVARIAGL